MTAGTSRPGSGWRATRTARRAAPTATIRGTARCMVCSSPAGPKFKSGVVVPPFENVHVYELICKVLGLRPGSNDGDPKVTAAVSTLTRRRSLDPCRIIEKCLSRPPPRSCPPAKPSTRNTPGICPPSSQIGTAWEAGYQALDRGIEAFKRVRGDARRRAAIDLLAALQRAGRRSASSRTGSGTTPRCTTTRISATTRSTPGGSACSCCSRAGARRRRGSIPSCCGFRSTTVRAVAGRVAGPRALPLLHRGSRSGSRNTCWMRRASGCCRCRAVWAACRTMPTPRCRPPTRAFRRSRCRPANRCR